nr:pectate lyase [uncultured bacterium]
MARLFRCVCASLGGWAAVLAAAAGPDWSRLLAQPDPWFRSPAGQQAVTNVLSWQSATGAWPKNLDTTREPRRQDSAPPEGTFDNGATTGELRFLARAFAATGDPRCEAAVLRGLDGILAAQLPSGGWPQCHPPRAPYQRHITFNDGVMVRILELLREIDRAPEFRWVDEARRARVRAAFTRGLECLLRCQVVVEGRLTVWCAQHDAENFQPRPARAYELESLSGAESAGILVFLMSLEPPTPEIARAVEAGAAWFSAVKLEGFRLERTADDARVVEEPGAPPLWARFYEIGTNRPIFAGRDGVKKYALSEIERERRVGYAWYGAWGEPVARHYAQWRERYGTQK